MKLLQITDQSGRDVCYDTECEACGEKETHMGGYNDRNYWDNVLPEMKCHKCGKSTNDINPRIK